MGPFFVKKFVYQGLSVFHPRSIHVLCLVIGGYSRSIRVPSAFHPRSIGVPFAFHRRSIGVPGPWALGPVRPAGILNFFVFSKMFQNVIKRALGALGGPWGPYFPLFFPYFPPPLWGPLFPPYFSF